MSFLIPSVGSTSRGALRSYPRLLVAARRSVVSTSNTSSAAAESSTATSSAPPSSSKPAPTLPPSSCPAGTPLPGLSILKDRPEPIALPDADYPPWLWSLLGTPALNTTVASTEAGDLGPSSSSSGGSGAGTALSKGQLRAQQKREFREKRAAKNAAARTSRGQPGARGRNTDTKGTAAPLAMAGSASTEESAVRVEEERKKALRKSNREAIRGRNFVKAA